LRGFADELAFDHAPFSAVCLEYFHDVCMVWPIEISQCIALDRHPGKLGNRPSLSTVLRHRRIGSDIKVYSAAQLKTTQEVITLIVQRAAEMESPGRVRLSGTRGDLCIREVVSRGHSVSWACARFTEIAFGRQDQRPQKGNVGRAYVAEPCFSLRPGLSN
jgi:hypothetical protein